jgi:hypothetical protein
VSKTPPPEYYVVRELIGGGVINVWMGSPKDKKPIGNRCGGNRRGDPDYKPTLLDLDVGYGRVSDLVWIVDA